MQEMEDAYLQDQERLVRTLNEKTSLITLLETQLKSISDQVRRTFSRVSVSDNH